jgi:AraC-like DNA-binding protein
MFRKDDGLPPLVSRVLSIALEEIGFLGSSRRWPKGASAPTVSKLADRFGCSREYLSRETARAGIPLGRFLKVALLVQAHFLRAHRYDTWEETAKAIGFREGSSLSRLSRNLTGYSVSDFCPEDLPHLIARLHDPSRK